MQWTLITNYQPVKKCHFLLKLTQEKLVCRRSSTIFPYDTYGWRNIFSFPKKITCARQDFWGQDISFIFYRNQNFSMFGSFLMLYLCVYILYAIFFEVS